MEEKQGVTSGTVWLWTASPAGHLYQPSSVRVMGGEERLGDGSGVMTMADRWGLASLGACLSRCRDALVKE